MDDPVKDEVWVERETRIEFEVLAVEEWVSGAKTVFAQNKAECKQHVGPLESFQEKFEKVG